VNALGLVVLVAILGTAVSYMLRSAFPRSASGGIDFLRAWRDQRRQESGATALETAAYVSLVAGLSNLSNLQPAVTPVLILIGLYLGLLLLPSFTRNALGFATAGIALTRLDPRTMIIVAFTAILFFIIRSLSRGLVRE